MAKAVGPLYADTPAIAPSVNFTFLPMPDTVPHGGCGPADDAEACVLHATDCLHGCSDKAAAALAAFVSCYEGQFQEMKCIDAATADKACIASSGVDKDTYTQCRADQALISQIQADIQGRGSDVHGFPKVRPRIARSLHGGLR